MDEKQRVKYMRRALALAVKGAGGVAPNPMVGAVIVKDDVVIGRGWHRCFGGSHAEVEALSDCRRSGLDPAGATLFVNLEPCCHHGKTPPCTGAIIHAGISRVEIAVLDEFAQVAGRGAEQLREHGIEVVVGCCRDEARRLNAGFFKLVGTGRPWVILKWAQSLDAKLAWPSGSGRRWISNELSRRNVHRLRSRCGAILVGIGTVLADDPLLTARLGRKSFGPLRVVLDGRLQISTKSKLAASAGEAPLLVCSLHETIDRNNSKVESLRARGCEVLGLSGCQGRIDLGAVLDELGRRGVADLLVEGGPTVLNAFWEWGLANELMVYIAPVIIGAGALSLTLAGQPGQLQNHTVRHLGDDVLITATVSQASGSDGRCG